MKNFLSLLLLININIYFLMSAAYCAEPAVYASASAVERADGSLLRCFPKNFKILQPVVSDGSMRELAFDVMVTNPSTVHKHDIRLPLEIILTDEFNNVYLPSQGKGVAQFVSLKDADLSLYPGERVIFPQRFQAPVNVAQQLILEIYDQEKVFYGTATYPTSDIENWNIIDNSPKISDDDLKIIYPSEKRIFAPGDTIFLKVGFSDKAGRPKSLQVILPNYVLMDDAAKGQYELTIPQDMMDGDFPVVVLAQWGDSSNAQVISKTLFFQIKG